MNECQFCLFPVRVCVALGVCFGRSSGSSGGWRWGRGWRLWDRHFDAREWDRCVSRELAGFSIMGQTLEGGLFICAYLHG